jgi:hypothetical protein
MRSRRFERFDRLIASLDKPLRIIDVGGTNEFWVQRGWAGREDVHITLVNLVELPHEHANIEPTVGDATALDGYADGEFDIAFSNSVIEHLHDFDAQVAMAREMRRVADAYWVQTPNFWFPMEPHFLVPGWQWLPRSLRISVLQHRPVGWMDRVPERERAAELVDEVRLLRRRELSRLFPDAEIAPERFGGLVKSWTALSGFPA